MVQPLTPREREQITEMWSRGMSIHGIAKDIKRSKSTVHKWVKRFLLAQGFRDRPRSGRPRLQLENQ